MWFVLIEEGDTIQISLGKSINFRKKSLLSI